MAHSSVGSAMSHNQLSGEAGRDVLTETLLPGVTNYSSLKLPAIHVWIRWSSLIPVFTCIGDNKTSTLELILICIQVTNLNRFSFRLAY